MIIHIELYERVQCLFEGWLHGLLIVAQWVRPGTLNGSLGIISPGEVWMTPPPRVVCVCIWIETLPGLIGIQIIYWLWLI